MARVDRAFAGLMIVGALLHAWGSVIGYAHMAHTLLWSLSAAFAQVLLACVNLLRVGRPGDAHLAWVSFAGCIAWLVIAIAFGFVIGNVADGRVIVQGSVALVLAGFSLRSAAEKLISRQTSTGGLVSRV